MLTVILGLTSAFCGGAADFLGGIASKRINSMVVTLLAALGGLAVLLVASLFVAGTFSTDAVLWGAVSGACAAVGLALLYGCLAIGPMSVLSPIAAVIGAAVPMFGGMLAGERLGPVGYVALFVALVAIALVAFTPEKDAARASLRGLLMAIGAGVSLGAFLIALDFAPADSGLIPLVANRIGNALTMTALIVAIVLVPRWTRSRRQQALVTTGSLPLLRAAEGPGRGAAFFRGPIALGLATGVIDGAGNIALLAGIRMGDLTVMSVLTGLYPAGTIILAAVLLRERILRVQMIGLVLALAAAVMFAIG
ncbi:EamA family transporter [Ruicaihuangia caeni]|uniref:EamA family transporter n=1 Tax=Ruicaihuangia caeni TaxID=3042517 RepID=A0AAW6TCT6_9MICO|nr:EamA family transporter [Klugiella sp. YN-L-19]MDI2099195.1 EamA family transporter [Klugiella sp. YN-L-19]